jgi:hypothetical protein
VLADDAGHRALPVRLPALPVWRLLARPGDRDQEHPEDDAGQMTGSCCTRRWNGAGCPRSAGRGPQRAEAAVMRARCTANAPTWSHAYSAGFTAWPRGSRCVARIRRAEREQLAVLPTNGQRHTARPARLDGLVRRRHSPSGNAWRPGVPNRSWQPCRQDAPHPLPPVHAAISSMPRGPHRRPDPP